MAHPRGFLPPPRTDSISLPLFTLISLPNAAAQPCPPGQTPVQPNQAEPCSAKRCSAAAELGLHCPKPGRKALSRTFSTSKPDPNALPMLGNTKPMHNTTALSCEYILDEECETTIVLKCTAATAAPTPLQSSSEETTPNKFCIKKKNKKPPPHSISRIPSHRKPEKRTDRPLAFTSANTSISHRYCRGENIPDRKGKYLHPIFSSFNTRDNSSVFPGVHQAT